MALYNTGSISNNVPLNYTDKVTILEVIRDLKSQVDGFEERIRDVEKFNAEIRQDVTSQLESALALIRREVGDQIKELYNFILEGAADGVAVDPVSGEEKHLQGLVDSLYSALDIHGPFAADMHDVPIEKMERERDTLSTNVTNSNNSDSTGPRPDWN